jgi:hypothetical protein
VLELFINRFAGTFHAELARARIEELKLKIAMPTPTPPALNDEPSKKTVGPSGVRPNTKTNVPAKKLNTSQAQTTNNGR